MGKRGFPKGFKIISDEYLVNKLKEAFVFFGRAPTQREIDRDKRFPSRNAYRKRFGSWNNALLFAGLEPFRRREKSLRKRFARYRIRFKILKRDNFTCQYCGRTAQDGAKLVIDHKNPVSNGGLTEEDNLITSCFECNVGKSNLLFGFSPKEKSPYRARVHG